VVDVAQVVGVLEAVAPDLVTGLAGVPELLFWAPVLLNFFIVFACQVYRYVRVSTPIERQQTKWFVVGFGLMIVSTTVVMVFTGGRAGYLDDLAEALLVLFLPLTVAIAILRYRLWDIDVLINRTLVYGSLTAMLVIVYFGGVATTQALFRAFTGQEEQPQLAVVVSTLWIAALFNPLRHRLQSFVDRRFYRRKYDAAKTLEAFNARLRHETEMDTLSGDVIGVVKETMQPAHVSLWLRPDPGNDR
jgi:tellurite resistance protein TehA-like permease